MRIFIGYDKTEDAQAQVAIKSLGRFGRTADLLDVKALRNAGLYTRTHYAHEQKHDTIDGKPFSTDFSFTRFLVPALCQYQGWALFVDSDVMFREDPGRILSRVLTDPEDYALYCVKHDYRPQETTKMRAGVTQPAYAKKNWSSEMLFNCSHRANWFLTPHAVNTAVGRDLQQMFWLRDDEIGELDPKWNWLEGHNDPKENPAIVHYTRGTPEAVVGLRDAPFAEEWWEIYNSLD